MSLNDSATTAYTGILRETFDIISTKHRESTLPQHTHTYNVLYTHYCQLKRVDFHFIQRYYSEEWFLRNSHTRQPLKNLSESLKTEGIKKVVQIASFTLLILLPLGRGVVCSRVKPVTHVNLFNEAISAAVEECCRHYGSSARAVSIHDTMGNVSIVPSDISAFSCYCYEALAHLIRSFSKKLKFIRIAEECSRLTAQ